MQLQNAIEDGQTLQDIFEGNFAHAMRNVRGILTYKRLCTPKRDWEMEIFVFWGGTGTGKTRKVYELYGHSLYDAPHAKGSGAYFDDLDGQETVLVDEMYGNRYSWGFLLKLCDRYALSVPVHGGTVQFNARRIVFTSNAHPSQWYAGMNNAYAWDDTNPLRRRITQIYHFTADGIDPPFQRDLAVAQLGATILNSVSDDAVQAALDARDGPPLVVTTDSPPEVFGQLSPAALREQERIEMERQVELDDDDDEVVRPVDLGKEKEDLEDSDDETPASLSNTQMILEHIDLQMQEEYEEEYDRIFPNA